MQHIPLRVITLRCRPVLRSPYVCRGTRVTIKTRPPKLIRDSPVEDGIADTRMHWRLRCSSAAGRFACWDAPTQEEPAAVRLEEWKAVVEELAGGITQHAHTLHVAAVEQHAACPMLAARCSGLGGGAPPPPPLTEAGLWEVHDDVTQLLLERVHDHVWPLVVESCRSEDKEVTRAYGGETVQ